MKQFILPIAMGLTVLTAGCSNQQLLSPETVMSQYQNVAQLDAAIKSALNTEVNVFSPEYFKEAKKLQDEAMKWATSGDDKGEGFAVQGLKALDKAVQQAAVARDELSQVISARSKAKSVGADKRFPERFKDAENTLTDATELLEKGKVSKVRNDKTEIRNIYSGLELDTLKGDAADQAKKAIQNALKNDVDDYAPKTLAQAQSELALSQQVLEADRNDTEKAAAHAFQALKKADRATQIAETIKEFKQSKLSDEDIVLWHQSQLEQIFVPLNTTPDFSQRNKDVVISLTGILANQVSSKKKLEAEFALTEAQKNEQIAQLQAQYAQLTTDKETSLAAMQAQADLERRQLAEIKAKFTKVQNMFNKNEAEVYQQGNNVLIRAQGFSFNSGDSEIQSSNFPLLNKIVESIKLFPASTVQVSGHTDNKGSDALNQKLSEDRASKVAQFLADIGGVESHRLSNEGYGKARPVASNETAEGRAANRRVEILIINQ